MSMCRVMVYLHLKLGSSVTGWPVMQLLLSPALSLLSVPWETGTASHALSFNRDQAGVAAVLLPRHGVLDAL